MPELSELPPPRKGAKEGYYPDPLGTERARWWDGASWTLRVGPRVAPDSPPGQPAQPPEKRCKHCGAASATFDGKCPNCGRDYGASRGVIIGAVAAACVAVVLLLGGCAALIAFGIDTANDEIDEHDISRAQFQAVRLGDPRARVRAQLGEPDRQKTNGVPPVTCLFYPEEGDSVFSLDEFRFCFVGGVLDSKSSE